MATAASYDDGSRLISRDEAALQLGVSPRTVARLNKSGELPAVQVSPQLVRINPEDLTRFIESRTSGHD